MELDSSSLTNLHQVPAYIRPEIASAVERAMKVGAPPPLEYVGAGMYGIVLCDQNDHAWKVARVVEIHREHGFMLDAVATEYEWLRDARKTPMSISRHIARVYAIHPEELVLERECVRGRAGVWADDRKLHQLHGEIEKAMLPLGWTAPEFKENSYIIRDDGTPVLVDISMALRVGENLVGYVNDVLAGRRKTHESWRDLAYSVLGEMRSKTIPQDIARGLWDRLNEKDPDIRKSFSF